MNERTRLDRIDSNFSEREQDNVVSDCPVLVSKHEGEYVAKFGIEMDGFTKFRPAGNVEDAVAARNAETKILHTLLHRMCTGQEISFVYSWCSDGVASPFTWEVVGSTLGDDAAHVLERARDLFHSIQFTLGDAADGAFSWGSSHGIRNRRADHSHCYSIRPDWIRVSALGNPSVGFVGQHGVPVNVRLSHSTGYSGSRLDSVMRIGKSGFGDISVTVNASPISLSSAEKNSISTTIQYLNDRGLGDGVLKSSSDSPILDESFAVSTIDRLQRWLNYPAGCGVTCLVSANTSVPKAILATIGSQLFSDTPLLITRIDEGESSEVKDDASLDLSRCIHQSEPPLPLLPCTRNMQAFGVRRAYPVPALAVPKDGLLIGRSGRSGQSRQVHIAESDRSRHCYVLGGTGTGKSTLLFNMITQDIDRGEGLCLIDPHGDLYEQVLDAVPRHRANDVIALDLGDTEYSVGMNFLECRAENRDLEANFIVNELMSVFGRLYDLDRVGGPMFEMYMRNALLAILGIEEFVGTLLDVIRFFESTRFRNYVLNNSRNRLAASFFAEQAGKASGDASIRNVAPYITAKLNQFTHNALLRPIIGQEKSTVDFRTSMDDGRIVLVNLSKGTLGELDARLLGMLLVGKIFSAALSRSSISTSERRSFYLYIDEFHNLATSTAVAMLSEARKFGLSLVMANQQLTQLSDDRHAKGLLQAILGNVATLLAFRLGPDDARILESFTRPHVDAEDLQNLPNFHAACRMINNDCPVPPFVLQTYPNRVLLKDEKAQNETAKDIIERVRKTYLRPRDEVDSEILERWGQSES